jgi:hypothetical protein
MKKMTEYKIESWKNPDWEEYLENSRIITGNSGDKNLEEITNELASFIQNENTEYSECDNNAVYGSDGKYAALLITGNRIKDVNMRALNFKDKCKVSTSELYALKKEGEKIEAKLIERIHAHEIMDVDRSEWSAFCGGQDAVSTGEYDIDQLRVEGNKVLYVLKNRYFQPTSLDFFTACPDYKKPLIYEEESKEWKF